MYIRKYLIIVVLLLVWSNFAIAQSTGTPKDNIPNSGIVGSYVLGLCFTFDGTNWDRCIEPGVSGGLVVGGPAASGATAAGNPLLDGGVYNSTDPAPTTGQIEPLQLSPSSHLKVTQGEIGETCNSSALGGAAASVAATLTGVSSKYTYLSAIELSCTKASAAGIGTATIAGINGGTVNLAVDEETGFGFYFAHTYVPPLISSAVNTNIVVTIPAITNGGQCVATACGVIQ